MITIIAAAYAVTTVMAGCSGGPSPSAPPAPPSNTSSSARQLPYAGAPKVANPLPDSVLSGSPCDALTPAQVRDALGSEVPAKADTLAGIGPMCSWSNLDNGAVISVFFTVSSKDGLSGQYANVKPKAQVWKELPAIQGFPAVANVSPSGGNPKEFCEVNVGISDTATVDASLILSDSKKGKTDPCSVTPHVADAAISTLRQKAGA
ncbi:DUF3558 domain-containing protein [Amycolatopsis minnesotensis]